MKLLDYGKSWEDFERDRLDEPGTVVEVKGTRYLIGSINGLRGTCDCCTAFNRSAIVEKYGKISDDYTSRDGDADGSR